MVDGAASTGWDIDSLREAGFTGFTSFGMLRRDGIPKDPGVYLVVRPDMAAPRFAPTSAAGWFKDRDPTVSVQSLEAAWVDDAAVVYIGKAAAGATGKRGLRKRIWEYRRHGFGERVGHWGGRYIWQLENARELLVAWMPTPSADPAEVEGKLIAEFRSAYAPRPFANRVSGHHQRHSSPCG